MPARKTSSKAQAAEAEAPAIAPPYWVATRSLPVADEMGAGGVRAFNEGDAVPLEHVERFGWQDYVQPPEGDWTPPVPAPPEQPPAAGTDKE